MYLFNTIVWSSPNESIAIFIEHPECFFDLLIGVTVLHLPCHHSEEFWEVNGAISVSVYLVNHVLKKKKNERTASNILIIIVLLFG